MKKNYTGRIILLLLLFTGACKSGADQANDKQVQATQVEYICPMHPEIRQEDPGTCPICKMDLVQTTHGHELDLDSSLRDLLQTSSSRIVSSVAAIKPESGARIFSVPVQGVITYDMRRNSVISSRISGRIEKLNISYNFQPVKKGEKLMEIYSPDLVAAQRELLFVVKNKSDLKLLEPAKQRLYLLGMTNAQVDQLIRTGKPDYSLPVYSPVSGYILETTNPDAAAPVVKAPAANGGSAMDGMGGETKPPAATTVQTTNTPVLIRKGQYISAGQPIFRIYRADAMVAEFSIPALMAGEVKKGQNLIFSLQSHHEHVYSGQIGLIQPIQRPGENFTLVRVYLNHDKLRAGQLLTANIPVVQTKGWWVPLGAVRRQGTGTVVFRKEGNAFLPVLVKTGIIAEGRVQVLDEIGDWEIASNAAFLNDRETFVTGMDKEAGN